MKTKIKMSYLFYILFLICFTSFVFLRTQEITVQQMAATLGVLSLPFGLGPILNNKAYFRKEVSILLLFIIIQAIRGYYRYGQGLYAVIYLSFGFFSLLLYLHLAKSYIRENGRTVLLLIERFGRFLTVVLFLIASIYNATGINLLDESAINSRNERARIYFGAILIILSLIISYGRIIDNQNQGQAIKKRDFIYCIIEYLYVLVVCQSRMLIASVTIALIMMTMVSYKKTQIKMMIIGSLMILS